MSILKIGMYASQFPTKQNYLTFSSDAPFSIKFNQQSWDGVLEYSLDAENWYLLLAAREINSVDNTLYLRGSGNSYITGEPAVNDQAGYAMQITATGDVECYGNIMSLLDHVNPDNVVMGYAAFASLFFEQDKLITSPELPATELAAYCYAHMLRGAGIEAAPKLPATVLAPYCYRAMFYSCINLTAAPELPATVLVQECYSFMFRGAGIEAAPELPATTLAAACYNNMFYLCVNIKVAPELPATVLAGICYYSMFRGTNIAISETQTGIYQTPWRIPSAGTIESEQVDWNALMLANTSGTFRGDPAINTTYYQAT